jgi:hypothetical protein
MVVSVTLPPPFCAVLPPPQFKSAPEHMSSVKTQIMCAAEQSLMVVPLAVREKGGHRLTHRNYTGRIIPPPIAKSY